jgi:hypothetical protein
MAVLKPTRWILLYLLAHIEFVTSQNIIVLVYFSSGDTPASVVAADDNAATYAASYTNMCRSGPCSQLTICTSIMVEGPSTAARTNIGDPSTNQTFECNDISSTTGTCTYIGTFRGTVNEYTTPFASPYNLWETLVVTAGLNKLSSFTVLTANGAVATTTTRAAPTSTPSTGPSTTSTVSSNTISANNTVSSGSATSTVGTGPPAFTGKNNSEHYNSN